MTDGTYELSRSLNVILSMFIEAATKLAVALAERRAQRIREAALAGERHARAERSRLAAHRGADAAIWRRTEDPAWWRKATPELIARAWQAASTWQHADPEAAGARQAMAERLVRRGVDVSAASAVGPGDARWLTVALALADAERDAAAARSDEADTDRAIAGQQPTGKPAPGAASADPAAGQAPASAAAVSGNIEALQKPATLPRTPPASAPTAARQPMASRPIDVLRQVWDQHKTDRVLADPAFPMLANTIKDLQRKGLDVGKLLRELPYDTTNAKIPAALTSWTLRAAAAGPAQLRAVQRQHHRHVERLPDTNTQARTTTTTAGASADASHHAQHEIDPVAAQAIRAAYPTTTKEALNQRLATLSANAQQSEPDYLRHDPPAHSAEPNM